MKRSVCAALAAALLAPLWGCGAKPAPEPASEPSPSPSPSPSASVLPRPDAMKMLTRTCVRDDNLRAHLGIKVNEPVTVLLEPMSAKARAIAPLRSAEIDGSVLRPCDIKDRVVVPAGDSWFLATTKMRAGERVEAGTRFETATGADVMLIGQVELTADGWSERFWWTYSRAGWHVLDTIDRLMLPTPTP